MRKAWKLLPWVLCVLVAAVSSVGAEDTTLLRIETLERSVKALQAQVATLQNQVAPLRQALIVNGSEVELRATGTLTLNGAAINTQASATLDLRGAMVRLNGGGVPIARAVSGNQVLCMTSYPGGGTSGSPGGLFPCTSLTNPSGTTTVFVP